MKDHINFNYLLKSTDSWKKKCRSRYPSEIEMYKDVIRYIGSQKDELDYFRTIIFRS